MIVPLSPKESDIYTALGDFLTNILPSGVTITQGVLNRVGEPAVDNWVGMTILRAPRLATNFDAYQDCLFSGSINGVTLTVTEIFYGTIIRGAPVFGAATGTQILRNATGTGGVGTYVLTGENQTVGQGNLASGFGSLLQPVKVSVQVDVHGSQSDNNRQIITTAFRDEYAVDFFASQNPNIAPLSHDDPMMVPFENENQQWERRWIVMLHLEVDQTIVVPQQFFDVASIVPVDIDVAYPV